MGKLMIVCNGLDGGLTVGAVVSLNSNLEIIGWKCWTAKNETEGHEIVALAAKALYRQIHADCHTCFMASEGVYIKIYGKRTSEAHVAKKLQENGFYDVQGVTNRAPITISKSFGIFLCLFPKGALEIPVKEWRKLANISNDKDSDKKALAIERALQEIRDDSSQASLLRSYIAAGNDHLAEAYFIAKAGLHIKKLVKCFGKVRRG